MKQLRFVLAAAVCVAVLAPALSHAQFDPAHNHLKCYKIKEKLPPIITQQFRLDNQFGEERIFKLTPQLLCVPTEKICCGMTCVSGTNNGALCTQQSECP